MKKILKLLEEYERKNNKCLINIRIYSDGSGAILTPLSNKTLFTFRTLNELKSYLKNNS